MTRTRSEFRYPSAKGCPDADTLHYDRLHPEDVSRITGAPINGPKTMRQERCPTCGYWAVWVPKP